MKKYSIYIITLIIGLLLGWLIFGGTSKTQKEQEHEHELTQTENGMWTCSMHPQINLPEFGACPICGMDLIPKIESEDGLSPDQFKMTENALALANIETVIVGDSEHISTENTLLLSGKVSTNEKATAIQTAHFGGRIEKLYYKSKGEFVKNGTLIASIYSPELVTAQNELIEALNIKDAQPELFEAVRNKLKYWKISETQINTIENTKKVISNFNMYANTMGYIDEVFIEEGNHVKEGAPLFKVANLGSVWANLDVYEQDIKNIRIGQSIAITLNAYPGKEIHGKINYIDPILNSTTRTVSVRATLANKDNLLKPGMLLSGKVKLTSLKIGTSTLSIPKSAVLWTGKRSVVYVKVSKDEPVFEMREVDLGNAIGSNYIILSGLKNGEEIVTNGTFTIDAAAQLQGKKSMMNPKGIKISTGGHSGMDMNGDNKTEIENKDSENMSNMTTIDKSKIDIKFKQQLGKVVTEYIKLKNAFVNDNPNLAQKEAKNVKNSLENVDMLLLHGGAHDSWMKSLKPLKEAVNKIHNSNEIDKQREAFLIIGENLSKAINTLDIQTENGQALYLEFCPMANNNNGGYWLSYDKEIKNPFYGKAMLTCGEVKATY